MDLESLVLELYFLELIDGVVDCTVVAIQSVVAVIVEILIVAVVTDAVDYGEVVPGAVFDMLFVSVNVIVVIVPVVDLVNVALEFQFAFVVGVIVSGCTAQEVVLVLLADGTAVDFGGDVPVVVLHMSGMAAVVAWTLG